MALLSETEVAEAFLELEAAPAAVLSVIEREITNGLRARPVHTWCPVLHKLLRELLARARAQGTKAP